MLVKLNKKKTLIFFGLGAFLVTATLMAINEQLEKREMAEKKIGLKKVTMLANHKILNENKYQTYFNFGESSYAVTYSIDEELQNFIEGLLKRFKSDYSSIVVIDNNTGKILANSGWARKSGPSYSLNFSSTHPSASLAKIITSLNLLENDQVHPESRFAFRGRGTTLYKYQLKNKTDRWTRYTSFKMAFAHSNNVVFGKAAINRTNASSIYSTALKMGFNQKLMDEGLLSKSTFHMPEDQYNMAEVASGFNRRTMMSPIHAAMLSSVIANDGKLLEPRLILKVKDLNKQEVVYTNDLESKKVVSDQTVEEIKEMMNLTVKRGTARGAFRRMKSTIKDALLIGGKTGSITGGVPFGKRDWFTMYAMPRHSVDNDKGISIAVMNVNVKKWHVKSTYLAKRITEYFYGSDEQLLSYGGK